MRSTPPAVSSIAPTIAATSTLAMIRAAESRGVGTADILHRARVDRRELEDPDTRLAAPVVLAIWNELIERTGSPTLQLSAPTSLPFGAYRTIDYLVGTSATVGQGIARFARFFRLVADAVALSIEEGSDTCCLRITRPDGEPVPPLYVDYVFAALVGRVRMRIHPELRVEWVELRGFRAGPPEAYESTFQAKIRFGADQDRLCFSAAQWNARIAGADEALARLVEEHAQVLAARLPLPESSFAARVRDAVLTTLSAGAGVEEVARSLNMSPRTLQRGLAEAGTTFREVGDAVRCELAKAYLADRRSSIPEVAFLLGFSEQSSFHRAFQRWTGEAPGRWRRRPHAPGATRGSG